jgi:hypothetical protein
MMVMGMRSGISYLATVEVSFRILTSPPDSIAFTSNQVAFAFQWIFLSLTKKYSTENFQMIMLQREPQYASDAPTKSPTLLNTSHGATFLALEGSLILERVSGFKSWEP